jgi:hypothetical protein
MQLRGPVPADLYHRYVEFKPFVKGMFSGKGIRGRILHHALHHQHSRIYNFSGSTVHGVFPEPSIEWSKRFLELVHFDKGARTFTYVIMLDGLFRFTETGKEFSIDMLSKHTMHSDVSIYIAVSGEFFVRRLEKPEKPAEAPDQVTHPPEHIEGGPPDDAPPTDPGNYELVVDNDSGTYRPLKDCLPILQTFLSRNFPGLKVLAKASDDEEHQEAKKKQREAKKKEGEQISYAQVDSPDSSVSDLNEQLDHRVSEKDGQKHKLRDTAEAAIKDPRHAVNEWLEGEGPFKKEEAEIAAKREAAESKS